MEGKKVSPLIHIKQLLTFERKEISAIYFFAVLGGLVQLSLPLGIQSVVNFVQAGRFSASLIVLIIMVVLGVFITGVLQVAQKKIIEKVEQKLFVRYALHYARTIPQLDLEAVNKEYLPELVNRFFDTVIIQKGVSKLLLEVPAATIQILFGVILLSFYNLAFVMFGVLLVVLLYLVLYFTGAHGLKTSNNESDYKYSVAAFIEELARSVSSFKFSKNTALHLEKTDEEVTKYLESRTSHFKILLSQYWSLIGFKTLITASMLIIGSALLVTQKLNVGQFVAAEIVILAIISSVEKLIKNLDTVYDVLTGLDKVNRLLEKPLEQSGTQLIDASPSGIKISAANISYQYSEDKQIFHSLDFIINEGEKVALSGATGSGKTTLLKILSGALRVNTGNIQVNNQPLATLNLSNLREQIGIQFQDQDLFTGSLWENLTMGNDNVSQEDLNFYCNLTGLHTFINSSAEGLQMPIMPAGQHLPKRTIHKILLVRALVGKPNLLLLENPLVSMDSEEAEGLINHIMNLACTVVVITSNPFTIARCQKLLVLRGPLEAPYYGDTAHDALQFLPKA